MSSGKSMQLLSTAYNFSERQVPFISIKPSVDTRDKSGKICSSCGFERDCTVFSPEENVFELIKAAKKEQKIDWVLVDEAQFLTEEQVDQLSDAVDFLDINVMCYGLRTDFKSHFFPGSKRLMEIADTIDEIKSRCSCGRKTNINARVSADGTVMLNGKQVEIGGNDRYTSLCRKCWKEKSGQIPNLD